MDSYLEEQKAIERRRRIAEAMMARGQAPIEVAQANGIPTPMSWTQGLANIANAYYGRQDIAKAEQDEKALAGRYETAQSDEMRGIIDALSKQQPAIAAPADALGGGPGRPEIPQTPEQKNAILVNAYLGSKYPQAQKTLPLLLAQNNAEISREDTQQAARDAAKLKYEDAAIARQEKINADIAAAKMAIDAKADAASKYGDLQKFLKGIQPSTPSMSEVIDPKDPSRMIRIDAKTYRGGSIGDAGVIGVSGKTPEASKKAEQVDNGRGMVNDLVATLRDKYDNLDKNEGIVSTKRGAASNIGSGIATSGVGQVVGRFVGTENQKLREEIKLTRPLLLQAIKQATGMSAKQMDSNVELKLWLSTATDPDAGLEANKSALENLDRLFGLGLTTTQTGNSVAPSGVPAELWNVMTPEEKKAWQQ